MELNSNQAYPRSFLPDERQPDERQNSCWELQITTSRESLPNICINTEWNLRGSRIEADPESSVIRDGFLHKEVVRQLLSDWGCCLALVWKSRGLDARLAIQVQAPLLPYFIYSLQASHSCAILRFSCPNQLPKQVKIKDSSLLQVDLRYLKHTYSRDTKWGNNYKILQYFVITSIYRTASCTKSKGM